MSNNILCDSHRRVIFPLTDEDGMSPSVEIDIDREYEVKIRAGKEGDYVMMTLDQFDRMVAFVRLVTPGSEESR